MDPMEILGSLLGQKAGGSSVGATILKEILLGGAKREAPSGKSQSPSAAPRSSPSRTASSPSWREPAVDDIEAQARELSDLLNVATDRSARRAPEPQAPQVQPPPPATSTRPSSAAPAGQGNWAGTNASGRRHDAPLDDDSAKQNEQATIFVRAMVNAAKCDGQISQAEQQSILGQLNSPSPAAIQFLREEFAKPLDVREFAWSVPIGLEQQVYMMSLIAIDVDSDAEQRYLRDLAHGLRLAPEVCDQIKSRLMGAGSQYAGSR